MNNIAVLNQLLKKIEDAIQDEGLDQIYKQEDSKERFLKKYGHI